MERVDARGLSCPQPVLLVSSRLKAMRSGEMEVLVDTETSRENVARAAQSAGWSVKSMESLGREFRLVLEKK
ncbi:MAG: sulfurtransferase TusA family protein [Thermodesulfobacteriota bacterium]